MAGTPSEIKPPYTHESGTELRYGPMSQYNNVSACDVNNQVHPQNVTDDNSITREHGDISVTEDGNGFAFYAGDACVNTENVCDTQEEAFILLVKAITSLLMRMM